MKILSHILNSALSIAIGALVTHCTMNEAKAQSAPFNAYSVATLGGACTEQGSVLFQSIAGISICLGAGSNGQVLMSGGAGADVHWNTVTGTGTVSSIGLTAPSIFNVTGSPVTAAGTIALALASENANEFLAAPDGSAGTPTFRAITSNDIPALPASKITSGTFSASLLPSPTSGALGGVKSSSAPANEFATGIDTSGAVTYAQPAFSNLSGTVSISQGGTGQTTAATARLALAAHTYVNSISALEALNPTDDPVAFLNSGLRSGEFIWTAGDFSTLVTADPDQGIYIAPSSDPTGASGAWVRNWDHRTLDVEWFGALCNASNNDGPSINAAVSLGTQILGDGITVAFPSGTCETQETINGPNRISFIGSLGGTEVRAQAPFIGSYLFYFQNGTTAMFGSRIDSIELYDIGVPLTAVVRSDAWQETDGMRDVDIVFDGTTGYGIELIHGYGGAAWTRFENLNITDTSNLAGTAGIDVEAMDGNSGVFTLEINGLSVVGASGVNISCGVQMLNDSLNLSTGHFENTANGICLKGVGNSKLGLLTGNTTDTNLVAISSGFTGSVAIDNMSGDVTADLLVNSTTGLNIAANSTWTFYQNYRFPESVAITENNSGENNITGDSTDVTLKLNNATELSNYDPSTGIFTIPSTGFYQISGNLTLNGLDSSVSFVQFYVDIGGSTIRNLFYEGPPSFGADSEKDISGQTIEHFNKGDQFTLHLDVGGTTRTVGYVTANGAFQRISQ